MAVVFRAEPKQPSEKYVLGIEWADRLDEGETVSQLIVVATDRQSGDNVTTTLVDSSGISGTLTLVRVKAGEDGRDYRITHQVTTSEGNVYEADIYMRVVDY